MDRAEIDNFLETMYASGEAAQMTVVNPETLEVSASEVPVTLPMPHHSHLGADGLPSVQADGQAGGGKKGSSSGPQKERVVATRRGPQREKVVAPVGAAATAVGRQPPKGTGAAPPGDTRSILRRRRQCDSAGEEDDDETLEVHRQKRSRQDPSKAPVRAGREMPVSDLDSFAAFTEFMTDSEREFLYHLCERLSFGGLAGMTRPTAIEQSPFSSAFGHLAVGLNEMFLAASKQPRIEGQLREEVKRLERELAEAKDRLADVERRLMKADCDGADARGKLDVAIQRDIERNDQVSQLEQDKALLQERVTAKEKKIDILQRESAARQGEVKRLEGELTRLRDDGSRAAAAAVESFKQSAEYKNALTEAAKAGALANVEMLRAKGAIDWAKASLPKAPQAKNAAPTKRPPPVPSPPAGGGSSGSGYQTPADGTIETPSPTARGTDRASCEQPSQVEVGDAEANP
ncbi:uncharacterized protein LOC133738491 [Rosa rugosa]|uniref:uncharacterized protein LOC133738491 n=1 Tax=Rosa rugosa TaxID=74645 RepID=UPI002B40CFBF|nr:uncharacterized protein LOC133738491 [Rosa rugosa]